MLRPGIERDDSNTRIDASITSYAPVVFDRYLVCYNQRDIDAVVTRAVEANERTMAIFLLARHDQGSMLARGVLVLPNAGSRRARSSKCLLERCSFFQMLRRSACSHPDRGRRRDLADQAQVCNTWSIPAHGGTLESSREARTGSAHH